MDDEDMEPRPSCNCRTSLCVRGYCPCFGTRWYCSDACRCEPCVNTQDREALVEERAEMILGKGKLGAASSQQSRGCTCRKSGCKKNYCDCFKSRVACTERCKCGGCANPHGAKEEGHNGDYGGASTSGGDSNGASDGTSNETAVHTDEAELQENLAAFMGPSDIVGQHVYAPSFAPYDPLADLDCFAPNVHTLLHQGSVQAFLDPNSVNSGGQDGPWGN